MTESLAIVRAWIDRQSSIIGKIVLISYLFADFIVFLKVSYFSQ